MYFSSNYLLFHLADGRILTLLGHHNEQTTRVDGFQEPGSFVQVNYMNAYQFGLVQYNAYLEDKIFSFIELFKNSDIFIHLIMN
jgi:hypothetical protein